MEEKEDWPMLEGSLKSIINNRKSPSDFSRTKYKGLKAMLKMPKEELRQKIIKECNSEKKFIQSHGNVNVSQQPIYKPSHIAVQFLAMNDLKPLKKRSGKFPRAQYFCHLCEYHCDTIEICISHIEDTRHSRLAKKQELETTLYHLPRANKKHLEALDALLNKIESECGLSSLEIAHRGQIAKKVNEILSVILPGSVVRPYGSSMTGIGLKNSDLNLDLQIPSEIPPHEALIKAYQALVQRPQEFVNVIPEFTAKIPVVSFHILNVRCELSLNNHLAYQTSALLRDYVNLSPRGKTLLVCLRFWAHICKLDRQAEGTLPPHSFALLMIHFLQRIKFPLLPCIHDYLNLSEDSELYSTPIEQLSAWKTSNQMSVAELWIEFFEHFSLGVLANDQIISIRSVQSSEDKWKGKKMAIEDPFSIKRSLTRSVNSLRVLDFIADCFRIAYLYFGTVQTTLGPIVTKIIVPPSAKKKQKKKSKKVEAAEGSSTEINDEFLNKLKLEENLVVENRLIPPTQAMTLEELEQSFQSEDDEEIEDEDDLPSPGESFEAFAQRVGTELTPKQAQKITDLVPKNMISFMFNNDILTAGQSPILVCTVCSNEGHLQNKCPDEQLPPLKPLPRSYDPRYVNMLNRVCEEVMNVRKPMRQEISERDKVMKELTDFVKLSYPTAILTVFGSSVNGFSFSKSDLDISLTFTDHETDEDLNSIEIIENLAEKLQKKAGILNVQAITSAKVPIIKFTTKMPKIECDISLYNILAQENTRMLRTYALIDRRVQALGYVVKEFAKKCDIGDASRGSLSSYAYILMLIYYLQKVQPPVVPVLQELNNENSVKIVDGWNAWFCDDLQNLPRIWPGLGQNKLSVSELWMGFLNFYAGEFDDTRHVVSIRMNRTLSKFEKMWNSVCIAIEDPFDLSHNLGAGISRKMNLYIKSAFIRARELFGIPSNRIPNTTSIPVLRSYFFDPELLTDGQPPNDRGCRACGKIGHLVRDCPKKKAADEHKKARKEHNKRRESLPQSPKPAAANKNPVVENKNPAVVNKNPAVVNKNPAVANTNPAVVNKNPNEDTNLMAFLQSQIDQFQPPQLPQGPPSLPALPNSAISVEDLERNMINPGRVLVPPPNLQQSPWPTPFGFEPGNLNNFLGGAPPMGFGNPLLPRQQTATPPQEKPLQLNQLPGFNIFGGPNNLFNVGPRNLPEDK